MAADTPKTQTSEETISSQVSVLENTASGLREVLGSASVYAAALEGGELRFRAVAPGGARLPEPLAPASDEELARSVGEGIVVQWDDPPEPFACGTTFCVPLVARGEVYGLAIAVLTEKDAETAPGLLALVGANAGSALAALQDCQDLAERISEMNDAALVLDALIESSHDAIKVLDLDGFVIRWNKGCEEAYGFSESEALGRKIPHIPEDLHLQAVQDIRIIAGEGRVSHREAAAVRKDGTAVAMEMTVIPMLDGEGHPSGVITIGRALAKGILPERPTSDITAMITNQIKGPLTSVLGYSQLLGRPEILEDVSRRTRTIRALEEQSAELNQVLDDLLVVARIHEGSLKLDLEPTDLVSLVTDVVSQVEQNASAHRFLIDFESGIGSVAVDRVRMSRALERLFEAVMSYAGQAETAVRVSLDRSWAVVSVNMKLDTEDPGASRLADALSTARPESVMTEGFAGLFLLKQVVGAHGGRVGVHAASDGSAVFTLRLPRVRA